MRRIALVLSFGTLVVACSSPSIDGIFSDGTTGAGGTTGSTGSQTTTTTATGTTTTGATTGSTTGATTGTGSTSATSTSATTSTTSTTSTAATTTVASSSSTSGGNCFTCAQVINGQGDPQNLCQNSQDAFSQFFDCVCNGACQDDCGDNICQGGQLTGKCQQCIGNFNQGCGQEFQNCQQN